MDMAGRCDEGIGVSLELIYLKTTVLSPTAVATNRIHQIDTTRRCCGWFLSLNHQSFDEVSRVGRISHSRQTRDVLRFGG